MAEIILTGDGQAYRHFTITSTHDITGKQVRVSFSSPGVDAPDADYVDAETVAVTQVDGSWLLVGRILLGPDGITLDPGTYKVFGRVDDVPERDAQCMGYLKVS